MTKLETTIIDPRNGVEGTNGRGRHTLGHGTHWDAEFAPAMKQGSLSDLSAELTSCDPEVPQ